MNEAQKFVAAMGAGWNLGNSFDSCEREPYSPERDIEVITAFHNPKPDRALFDAVKNAGFSVLRLPCSWHNHMTEDFVVSDRFLEYYKNAVDTALSLGFYVIINIHHDDDKAFIYPDSEHLESSWRFINAVWTRLAETFKDYDEHLLFEAFNEPRLRGTEYEWIAFDKYDEVGIDSLSTISELCSRFVKLIRESGGKNVQRYLMLPSHAASPGNAIHPAFVLPSDSAKNRLILSVHAYIPYPFALAPIHSPEAVRTFDDKNPADTEPIDHLMSMIAEHFPDTPVIIGEFGASNRNDNTEDRERWVRYYTGKARIYGFPCIWWDNGMHDGDHENFGIFDRHTKEIKYPTIVKALLPEDRGQKTEDRRQRTEDRGRRMEMRSE
jgi:endoglucanase